MGVIKTIRRYAGVAGQSLDGEDRQVLAQLIIWALGLLVTATILAASLGLAVRVFGIAAG